tara:strand:- start:2781 stop:3383 length:603 start_codon:yes stop_codon:yes gene_type:complete
MKLAVDVVLLPDERMSRYAVEVSEGLSRENNDKIVLHRENCLPHISLLMGVLDEESLPKASDKLEKVASRYNVFNLKANSYHGHIIPSGASVSEFSIERTNELQALHEDMVAGIGPDLTYDPTLAMVYPNPTPESITLGWIRNYLRDSAFEKFRPHITTGFGVLDGVDVPIDFTSSTLAIYQLGNYCTCRKELASVELKG